MAENKRVHIVPRNDGWAVLRANAERDSSHHRTQAVQREVALQKCRIGPRKTGQGHVLVTTASVAFESSCSLSSESRPEACIRTD